ncbi:MAG TPA: MFS transporter [Longimicrobiales bacterium]
MNEATAERSRARTLLLIAGMLLVAINLRPALASVGPLVEPIRAATGLSATAFGLLTTLPLIAFGVVSTLAPSVVRRLGLAGALVLAMALVVGGAGARPFGGVALLFLGTAALGVGIALGNVLMPALVKREFPRSSGAMTSVYSSAMGLGATIAAGVSVPLATALDWRGALAVWSIPAAVALLVWLPQVRRQPAIGEDEPGALAALHDLGRSKLAWQVALFMGLQSLTFYVFLAWLPDLLQSRGMDAQDAGWMLALSQATGIAGSALIPAWAGRRRDQRGIVALLGVLELIGIVGLMPDHVGALAALWVGLIGFALGGTFGLALLFIVLRTRTTRAATELSGMAQAIGYLVAAVGPALIGFVRDATGGWIVPLVVLLAALGGKVVAGLGAARDRVLAG